MLFISQNNPARTQRNVGDKDQGYANVPRIEYVESWNLYEVSFQVSRVRGPKYIYFQALEVAKIEDLN